MLTVDLSFKNLLELKIKDDYKIDNLQFSLSKKSLTNLTQEKHVRKQQLLEFDQQVWVVKKKNYHSVKRKTMTVLSI